MADAPAIPGDADQTTGDTAVLAALAGLLHDIGKFAQRAGARRGTILAVRGSQLQDEISGSGRCRP